MARPASRTRRGRDEEDEDSGRRGRGPAPRKPSGPPPVVLLGGVAIVVVAVILGVAMGKPKKPIEPPKPALVQKPVKVETTGEKPLGPAKNLPKPLTETEKAFINDLFKKADPHIQSFRAHAKAGWDLKKKEDNDGANEEWIDAKHDFQKAVGIVSEALEDADRFPEERPGMKAFNDRLGAWQKEFAALPKVNVTR
jgi:hypothetical protein